VKVLFVKFVTKKPCLAGLFTHCKQQYGYRTNVKAIGKEPLVGGEGECNTYKGGDSA